MGLQPRREVHRLSLCEWSDAGMAENEEPELSTQLNALISNAEVGTHLSWKGRLGVSFDHLIGATDQ
jgi:hypothetical protein